MIEKGERVRHEDRRADALRRARRNQNGGGRRQRASQRSRRENAKARHEDFLGPYAIAERTGCQNERRKSDGVGADHPLQFGHAAAE